MHDIDRRPAAIFLMGPTASGKTALACRLAERFKVDLVSVDSALIYRGLDVGAAKPDATTLARFPHRLIDIREPTAPYSAAEFRRDALLAMNEITVAGRVPLLVGGTSLYFRALAWGLAPLPDADPELRQRLSDEAARLGWPALHARLAAFDSRSAARFSPNDAQRIQRALEIAELTGEPPSRLLEHGMQRPPFRILKLALQPVQREVLHERIAQRMDVMLDAGLVEEARRLRELSGWHPDLPAMRAVGYRQAWPYLAGQSSLAEFRQRAIFATRQLAKRQLTWLRGEIDAQSLDSERVDLVDAASARLGRFLSVAA